MEPLKSAVICTGDPIIDIWIHGHFKKQTNKRFYVEKTIRTYGGALNTWKNLVSLLGGERSAFASSGFVSHVDDTSLYLHDKNIYSISRIIDDEILIEYSETPESINQNFYSSNSTYWNLSWSHAALMQRYREIEKLGLVISEYNRGSVNCKKNYNVPYFDFCIVDTRYKTLNLNLIKNCSTKIWHATGDEYNEEYAKNFDWILNTNGPDEVKIFKPTQKNAYYILQPPDTPVISSCGAGDTFTAAVAAYLSDNPISEESIVMATNFAVNCCQQVIQKPYTSIINKEELKCISQISMR